MPRFRKKPVEIEAFQVPATATERSESRQWLLDNSGERACALHSDGTVSIQTLEGTMVANHCDWIIRGVKGELYPCKPDIFEATYEPVE